MKFLLYEEGMCIDLVVWLLPIFIVYDSLRIKIQSGARMVMLLVVSFLQYFLIIILLHQRNNKLNNELMGTCTDGCPSWWVLALIGTCFSA